MMKKGEINVSEIKKLVTAELYDAFRSTVAKPKVTFSPSLLNKYIDHTLLKPEATIADVKKICEEAKKYKFASVCVNSCYIKFVSDSLKGSDVKSCTVVGFPLGAMIPEAKAGEALASAKNGAEEIDMVVNIGAIKSGDWIMVHRDIEGVVKAVQGMAIVKVILETCLLTYEEKVKACAVSKLAGAHFVKTSTGFSSGGATVEDVRLMRETIGPEMGLKASGGIRTFEDALNMINAGATRLGTSSGVALVSEEGSGDQNKCENCGLCGKECPSDLAEVIKNLY